MHFFNVGDCEFYLFQMTNILYSYKYPHVCSERQLLGNNFFHMFLLGFVKNSQSSVELRASFSPWWGRILLSNWTFCRWPNLPPSDSKRLFRPCVSTPSPYLPSVFWFPPHLSPFLCLCIAKSTRAALLSSRAAFLWDSSQSGLMNLSCHSYPEPCFCLFSSGVCWHTAETPELPVCSMTSSPW